MRCPGPQSDLGPLWHGPADKTSLVIPAVYSKRPELSFDHIEAPVLAQNAVSPSPDGNIAPPIETEEIQPIMPSPQIEPQSQPVLVSAPEAGAEVLAPITVVPPADIPLESEPQAEQPAEDFASRPRDEAQPAMESELKANAIPVPEPRPEVPTEEEEERKSAGLTPGQDPDPEETKQKEAGLREEFQRLQEKHVFLDPACNPRID